MLRCKIQVNFREIFGTLSSAIDESRDIPGLDLHRPTTRTMTTPSGSVRRRRLFVKADIVSS